MPATHTFPSLLVGASWQLRVALLLGVSQVEASPLVPLIDLHVDLSYQVNYEGKSLDTASGQLVASELLESGVVGLVLPLFVPNEVSPEGPRLFDLEGSYAQLYGKLLGQSPYVVPSCTDSPARVKVWFAFEGAAPFAERPEEVAKWVSHGVRIWGLVHRYDNALASSAGIERRPRHASFGLTRAGWQLVKAIHAAHGIVDVSHASDRAFADILQLAREDHAPVIATHSNCRSLAPHARNLTDAQLRAIAEQGGVVGINFHGPFLRVDRRATLADVVAHIEHVANLVGVEHVAIGSDFEGGIRPPRGLESARSYPKLAQALSARGFTEQEITQVFSGNVRRLLSCPAQ